MNEDALHRALLDERSAALASRARDAAHAVEHRDYLVCAVGPEQYGFSLAETASVGPARVCTSVPGSPRALRGIVAQAGVIVNVIDLAEAMGLIREDDIREGGHLLRLRADNPPIALAVDRVVGLARVAADVIEPSRSAEARAGLGAEAVSGYVAAGSDRRGAVSDGFAIVDLPRLLRPFLT